MSAIDAVDDSWIRHVSAMDVGALKARTIQGSYPMPRIATVGLDIATSSHTT